MKTRNIFFAAALLTLVFSCAKENLDNSTDTPGLESKSLKTLTVAAPESTKTAFVGGEFMWKKNNNINVRSNNSAGYTVFTYTGDDTSGPATFDIKEADAADRIVTGPSSFAVYPATGAREEDGSLKMNLKTGYTWFEGNVEAPMLAQVTDDGTNLQFKHVGGLLKVTYKYLPPKAAKLIVWAPCNEDGMVSYKICSTMRETVGWRTEEDGFTGETPYVQAYPLGSKYEITQTISSATAAQRASEDGLTVYIPLPVGPGDDHIYPEIKVRLAFADGTTVPGSERTGKNVKIERAVIKEMRTITLTKYTTETLVSGLARTPHGLTRISDNQFVVTAEQYHVYFLDVVNKTATQSATNSTSKYPQYPYGVCYAGGNLWIANKVGATGNSVYKYDMTSEVYSIAASNTGINQPMQIKEHGGSIYVLGRGDGSSAGKIYVYENGFPGAVDAQVYADFSQVSVSTGYAWPMSFDFDTDGSMVVAVSASAGTPSECFKLYRVASKGATPVAFFGSGVKATSYASMADGSAANASFAPDMLELAFDGSGNLFVADQYSVREIVRGATGLDDGTLVTLCESSELPRVDGLAFDSTYKHMYLSNKSAKCIYKVTIEP